MVKCARFISECDIENAVRMKKKYYEIRGHTLNQEEKRAYEFFVVLYNQLFDIYLPPFPPGYTSKDYICEECLRLFWDD